MLANLLLWIMVVAQQVSGTGLRFDALVERVATAPSSGAVQELTVSWATVASPPNSLPRADAPLVPLNQFLVTARRLTEGPLHVDRNPELSADQLVVVGADASGTILSWTLLKDPRIVRAEQPGPDGVLTGQTLIRSTTQLLVALPDSPQLTQAGVYQPRWTGTRWELDLIGSFAVGGTR